MMATLGQSIVVWLSVATVTVAGDKLGAELEPLVRRYRMDAYQTFQNNRSEYDRYLRALQTLTEAYQLRGGTDSDRQDVAEWVQASRQSPELPPFPPWVARLRARAGSHEVPDSSTRWKGERVGPERTRPTRKRVRTSTLDPSPVAGTPWISSLRTSLQFHRRFGLVDMPPQTPMADPRSQACAAFSPLPEGTELVDVGELTTFIDGFNEAVRSLEGLVHQETVESLPRLASIVRELEELQERQKMQAIYVAALSPTSALTVPPHRSTNSLRTNLTERLRTMRSETRKSPLGETQEENLGQIEALLRRLDALPTDIP